MNTNKKIITYVGSDSESFNKVNLICNKVGAELSRLKSIHELFPSLSDTAFFTDLLLIDIDQFITMDGTDMFDIVNTLSTLISCTVCRRQPGPPTRRKTAIAITATVQTNPELIKEVLGLGPCVLGVYPKGLEFTDSEKEYAMSELLAGHCHIPVKIASMLKKKRCSKTHTEEDQIFLTPRQQQIAKLVSTRGLSNKMIARVLGISESTVKLHISSILKKYGVKSRTQLVVFGKDKNNNNKV